MSLPPNFNPRTREGCDSVTLSLITTRRPISIHAPVKGAMFRERFVFRQHIIISIHAPVKGAIQRWRVYQAGRQDISIHAPVKGAI